MPQFRLTSNAEELTTIYGEKHPHTLIAYIADTMKEMLGDDCQVAIRTLRGKTPKFEEITKLFKGGRLCWCVTLPRKKRVAK